MWFGPLLQGGGQLQSAAAPSFLTAIAKTRVTRTSQPTGAVGIDPKFGATFVFCPSMGMENIATRNSLTVYNADANSVENVGIVSVSTNANASYCDPYAVMPSLTDFTALIVYKNITGNTTGIFMAARPIWYMYTGFVFENKTDENTLEFCIGTGAWITMTVPGIGAADGRFHTLAIRLQRQTVTVAVDGVVIGTSATTNNASNATGGISVLNYTNNGSDGFNQTNRKVALATVMNNSLSLSSLTANPWQIFTPVTRTVPVAAVSVTLPTLVRPASDTSAGAWTASTGGTLASCIDESTYSDADYISVNSASTCELVLSESAYPGGASQTLTYRASSTSGSTLTVTLKQGATTIMTRTHTLTSTVTEYVDTLTAGEIAAIVAGPISVTLQAS